ncbi:MAG: phage terminase small subunit-related protein [Candidatus Wallbacteria bacterium]
MAKKNLLPDAERMYISEARTIIDIAKTLGVSDKTVWSWVKQYNWESKRENLIKARTVNHSEMYSLATELIRSITDDMQGGKEPSAQRVQLLCKLWDIIPKAQKYESETNKDVKPENTDESKNAKVEALNLLRKELGLE